MTYPKFIRGMRGYATILKFIADADRKVSEMRDVLGIKHSEGLRMILKAMRDAGLVHIKQVIHKPTGGKEHVWAFGPGENADDTKDDNLRKSVELICFLEAIQALSEPQCVMDLQRIIGATYGTTRIFVARLRDLGLIYVDSWQATGCGGNGGQMAYWRFGVGKPDALKPRMYRKDARRRWRRRSLERVADRARFAELAANIGAYSMREAA